MGEKGNTKVVWYILFAVITVVLCYLFVVVYFYYISPANISLKIAFWPFASEERKGELCADAVAEINFNFQNDDFEEETKTVLGVNVSKDGFLIAPASEFRSCKENTDIKILFNTGKIYKGNILYSDYVYNLSVIKCENIDESNNKIEIPFVKITDYYDSDIIAVSSPVTNLEVWTGKIVNEGYYRGVVNKIDGLQAIDYVIEDGTVIELNSKTSTEFVGGAIFDDSANFLGFSYSDTMTSKLEKNNYFISPSYATNYFLDKVVDSYYENTKYSNYLFENLIGFDQIELDYYVKCSETNSIDKDKFYFKNVWHNYNENINYFYYLKTNGFYVFEDFVYNEQTILTSGSVITGVKANGEIYTLDNKLPLYEAFYSVEKGDRIYLYYEEIESGQTTTKIASFVV